MLTCNNPSSMTRWNILLGGSRWPGIDIELGM
jgi:hypothetical protein